MAYAKQRKWKKRQIPKPKTFEGMVYKYHVTFARKDVAESTAKAIRAGGKKVRRIKDKHGHNLYVQRGR